MEGTRLNTAVAAPNELLLLPLGGAGEIGINLTLYGYGGKWLMVDLGVGFGEEVMPGIDVVMPDPKFIVERKRDLLGLVVTHAHEDHIGAIPYLWRQLECPIYATPFTAALVRRKLREVGLEQQAKVTVVPLGGTVKLGPFEVDYITVTHSVPEPNALAIRTPAGTVLHTGDWKLDPEPLVGPVADEAKLRRVGDAGVLALVGDSTNVFREGNAGSEAEVRASLTELIAAHPHGRVIIACFASNVARVESVARAAHANDRNVALVGRSLRRMDEVARETGYLKGLPPFVTEEDAEFIPRDKLVLLCTGSQAEPRAALTRMSMNDHPNVTLEEDDTVIFSSRIIPGNERAIGQLHDRLIRAGVKVITELDHFVHVSGHPARDELRRMYELIRPRIAIPVHGELRHLTEHAALARACGVPETLVIEDGSVVKLGPGPAMIIDQVSTGRLAVDGNRLIAVGGAVVRDRQRIAFNGSAVATLVFDRARKLVAAPVVSLQGLVDEEGGDGLVDDVTSAVRDAVDGMPSADRGDDQVREAARRAVRRVVRQRIGHKPVTDVHIVRL